MSEELEKLLIERLDLQTKTESNVVGGCVSSGKCYFIENNDKIFVKTKNSEHSAVMFTGEYESLKQIYTTNTVKVPTHQGFA